jgi:GTPase SAR1 family protein
MAGKTSLVDALMKGRSTEIDVDDRTFGVVFYHWKPEPHVDELELVVVDCAGQKNYLMTHQLFLSEGNPNQELTGFFIVQKLKSY